MGVCFVCELELKPARNESKNIDMDYRCMSAQALPSHREKS